MMTGLIKNTTPAKLRNRKYFLFNFQFNIGLEIGPHLINYRCLEASRMRQLWKLIRPLIRNQSEYYGLRTYG